MAIPLILEHAYSTQTTRETCAAFSPCTLVADLTLVHRHQQGRVPYVGGHFPWNPLMRGNVWAHETKPVLLEPLLGVRRAVTQLLSQHRDLVMATRRSSERRTWERFTDDGGLEGASSRHAANRAQKVREWLAALRGVARTSGSMPTAELASTADGRVHTLVTHTGPSRSLPLDERRMAAPPMPAVSAIESPAGQAARALVASLHARCHGHAPPTLSPPARDQATVLMARDGAHRTRALVDAARHTAPTPRDDLTSFGGMVPCETCAREADDRQQQRAAAQQAATRRAERHAQSDDACTEALARRTAHRAPEALTRVHQRGAHRRTQEGKTARGAMGLAVRVGMDAARMPRADLPSCDAWYPQQEGTAEQVPHDDREEQHA